MLEIRDVGRAAIGMAVLVLALVSTAYAQAIGRGKITDQWDNPIPNVQIVAVPVDERGNARTRDTTTDENGDYVLQLTAEDYTVTFLAQGYQGIRVKINPHTRLGCGASIRQENFELKALPPGGRLRGSQTFEAEGGIPKVSFDDDGTFEFEDAEGEGEGTYGVVEQNAYLVVRDYDGPDDKYTILEPITVPFSSDQFTSFSWGDATLMKK